MKRAILLQRQGGRRVGKRHKGEPRAYRQKERHEGEADGRTEGEREVKGDKKYKVETEGKKLVEKGKKGDMGVEQERKNLSGETSTGKMLGWRGHGGR